MQMPSGNGIDFKQRGVKVASKLGVSRPPGADFELNIHGNELNKHHLQDLADGETVPPDLSEEPAQQEVDYAFGDAGSQWRMTRLKAVFRQAEESGRSIEDVAIDKFGNLRTFDDVREERTELDRRETYGPDYVGKEKPSGDLFKERKLDEGIRSENLRGSVHEQFKEQKDPSAIDFQQPAPEVIALDQTTLNRLKARMMKAKLRGASNAKSLEAEYNTAVASSLAITQPDTHILNSMENRMLVGGRKGEIKNIDNKRGRERGLVEENEDMSIDDMVREERRTRYQAGSEGQRFAERIAKDGKFDVSQLLHSNSSLTLL